MGAIHGQSEEVHGRFYGAGATATSHPKAEAAFRKKLKDRLALTQFLSPLEVASFERDAAAAYGRLRATLLIAAHALSLAVRLVTNNTREFQRVPGLRVETWA